MSAPQQNDTERALLGIAPAGSITRGPPMLLMMSGIIGAGKTRLANRIAARYKMLLYHEIGADRSKIDKFYTDQEKYGFSLQVSLLARRITLCDSIPLNEPAIMDRSPYEDDVFANMLHSAGKISDYDYDSYLDIAKVAHAKMRQPTAILHLDVTPEESLRRIAERNVESEKGITIEYLRELHATYEKWIPEIAKTIPVIRIDWSEFLDVDKVVDAVVEAIESINMMRKVTICK